MFIEPISSKSGPDVLIHAFFDESDEGEDQRGYLAVAGYVFDDLGLRGLEAEWKDMLDTYELPHFHMAECNADDPLSPRNVFCHLNEATRVQAARDAIAIAREYPLHGVAYVVRKEDYRELLEDGGFGCDAYSFLLWTALLQVSKWCGTNVPDQGLSLHFESGYRSQSKADALLHFVIRDGAVWRNKRRPPILKHSFFDKDNSYPGQAADLLAWNIRKGNANAFVGKPIRKDTLALIDEINIWTVHYPRERLIVIRDYFIQKSGTLARASQILFAPIDPSLADEREQVDSGQ